MQRGSAAAPPRARSPTAAPLPAAPPTAGEPDFSKKHALETKWTLWFDNPNGKQKQATWGQTLRAVYTFDSVEDFWWCVGVGAAEGGRRRQQGGSLIVVFPQDYKHVAGRCALLSRRPPALDFNLPLQAPRSPPTPCLRARPCSLYNNIIPPSRLSPGSDLHLFREGEQGGGGGRGR